MAEFTKWQVSRNDERRGDKHIRNQRNKRNGSIRRFTTVNGRNKQSEQADRIKQSVYPTSALSSPSKRHIQSKFNALKKEKIYKSTLFKIDETLVDESKLHITPEKACEQILEYLKQQDVKLWKLREVKE